MKKQFCIFALVFLIAGCRSIPNNETEAEASTRLLREKSLSDGFSIEYVYYDSDVPDQEPYETAKFVAKDYCIWGQCNDSSPKEFSFDYSSDVIYARLNSFYLSQLVELGYLDYYVHITKYGEVYKVTDFTFDILNADKCPILKVPSINDFYANSYNGFYVRCLVNQKMISGYSSRKQRYVEKFDEYMFRYYGLFSISYFLPYSDFVELNRKVDKTDTLFGRKVEHLTIEIEHKSKTLNLNVIIDKGFNIVLYAKTDDSSFTFEVREFSFGNDAKLPENFIATLF